MVVLFGGVAARRRRRHRRPLMMSVVADSQRVALLGRLGRMRRTTAVGSVSRRNQLLRYEQTATCFCFGSSGAFHSCHTAIHTTTTTYRRQVKVPSVYVVCRKDIFRVSLAFQEDVTKVPVQVPYLHLFFVHTSRHDTNTTG